MVPVNEAVAVTIITTPYVELLLQRATKYWV